MDASTQTSPALGVSFNLPLDERGRNLVFQTHIDAASSPQEINALLDKVVAAGERQFAKYELKRLELDLRALKEQVKRQEDDLPNRMKLWEADFAKRGRKGDFVPSPAQHAELLNAKSTIDQLKKRVTLTEDEIVKTKAQIAEGE